MRILALSIVALVLFSGIIIGNRLLRRSIKGSDFISRDRQSELDGWLPHMVAFAYVLLAVVGITAALYFTNR